jgi:phage gp36-like protein
MPYITQTDLLQRMTLQQLAQLTDDSGAKPPAVDATIVDGVLEEASGQVDGYCRTKYATPLQQSDEVMSIARDIAVYLLYSRRNGQMPDQVTQRYKDRMALLKDISKGVAVLDQPVNQPPQSIAAGPVRNDCGLRFKEEDIKGFV